MESKGDISEKPIKLEMPVKLTENEKAVVADRVTALELEVAELEAEKKRIAKQFKDKIKPLEEEILEKSQIHQDGSEEREVGCLLQFNYKHGKVTTIRRDTNQVVDERSMTSEEMQRDMLSPDEPQDGPPKDGDSGDPEVPEAPEAPAE